MRRRSFYTIPREVWLHIPVNAAAGPEEDVRQWCAHELIRAYGICVTDLNFEAQAKVGSKTYRIDILIEREGKPWIVVECKRRDQKAHDKAMEQAISYADAQRIRAEFTIYTNGDVWHVRRRVDTVWCAVPDLPIISGEDAHGELVDHLRVLQSFRPMLFKLDQEIKGAEAARFISAMQQYFNGSHSWCNAQHPFLLHAADNLLRVLCDPSLHPSYRWGKLATASQSLEAYAASVGISLIGVHVGEAANLGSELRCLSAAWRTSVDFPNAPASVNAPLIRLITAVLEYGQTLPLSASKYPPIPPGVQGCLRDYLDSTLRIYLALQLPERSDNLLMSELRHYCAEGWRTFDRRP